MVQPASFDKLKAPFRVQRCAYPARKSTCLSSDYQKGLYPKSDHIIIINAWITLKVWNPQSYSLSYHASSKHIHCSLMHGSYLSIIWSFWPISSSFALKYEFHLSLSSLEGLIDLEACPDEFEYASPEMLSGLWRRTLVPSLTCPRCAGYPTEVVAIVEEVEIPETLLYTKSGWTNTYHTCTPSFLFHHAISSFYPTVFSENFQRSCRFPHNTHARLCSKENWRKPSAPTLQVKVFAWSPLGNQFCWFRETFLQIKSPASKLWRHGD